jgi:uncharacterized damage-inducible protein DinB
LVPLELTEPEALATESPLTYNLKEPSMPTSNPLDILLEHDKWATQQLLSACEKLTADQFAQKFELGRSSLQASITHIIAAISTWTDTLTERPMRQRIDQGEARYSVAELTRLHHEAMEEFMATARTYPLDQIITRVRDGKEYSFTRGAIITHVATHGMHHRAQCLNMLRQLGFQPLPASSVADWARLVDVAL